MGKIILGSSPKFHVYKVVSQLRWLPPLARGAPCKTMRDVKSGKKTMISGSKHVSTLENISVLFNFNKHKYGFVGNISYLKSHLFVIIFPLKMPIWRYHPFSNDIYHCHSFLDLLCTEHHPIKRGSLPVQVIIVVYVLGLQQKSSVISQSSDCLH
jgi:hypothetical protein